MVSTGASSVISDSASSTPLSTPKLTATDVTGENHADFVERLFDFGSDVDVTNHDSSDDDDAADNDGDNDKHTAMQSNHNSGLENSHVAAGFHFDPDDQINDQIDDQTNNINSVPSRHSQFHETEMMF